VPNDKSINGSIVVAAAAESIIVSDAAVDAMMSAADRLVIVAVRGLLTVVESIAFSPISSASDIENNVLK
jgi:hypothetical protein